MGLTKPGQVREREFPQAWISSRRMPRHHGMDATGGNL
jgi:hypothetical protein